MASFSSLYIREERDLKRLKPSIGKLVLEYLQSYGSAHDDRSKQPCGVWLTGALAIAISGAIGLDISSTTSSAASKKSKPGPTNEDDGRILTALMRFVAKVRSETEMDDDLFADLNNTNGCHCAKAEYATVKDDIFVDAAHEFGRTMNDGYRKSAYLPLINQNVSSEPHLQDFPRSLIHRGSSPSIDLQTHKHFSPIGQADEVKHASPAVDFMASVFGALAGIIQSRVSLSFSKGGRSKYWPYSPREFLLLLKDPAAQGAPASSSDDTEACASNLILAFQEWSYRMPNPSPTTLLTIIVHMCGTLLIPTVVDHSYSIVTLPDAARYITHSAMTTLREIDHAEPSLSHFAKRKAVGLFVDQHCNTIARYYWMLMSLPGVPPKWNDTMLPENCLRMAQLFTMMMYLLEDSRIPFSIRNSENGKWVRKSMCELCFKYHTLARLMINMEGVPYADMGMVCHPRLAQHYADVREGNNPYEALIIDPHNKPLAQMDRQSFLLQLTAIRLRTYCCAWGCSKSVQEVGAEFKACSACGIVKYCGRACQKLDWKGFTSSGEPLENTESHHSKICKLLKKFATASSDKDTFAKEVILRDRDWRILATWTKGLSPPGDELPHPPAKPSSPGESLPGERLGEWEDFDDILLEFVLLSGAPEPVCVAWQQADLD